MLQSQQSQHSNLPQRQSTSIQQAQNLPSEQVSQNQSLVDGLRSLKSSIIQADSEAESPNKSGGLAGLAWHTSPIKISPGKAAAQSQDNSFKITIPTSTQAQISNGNDVNHNCHSLNNCKEYYHLLKIDA